jgi:hypothetical protein
LNGLLNNILIGHCQVMTTGFAIEKVLKSYVVILFVFVVVFFGNGTADYGIAP